MKTTGVIRRIDELGRIVIPKEIRKNLRIKNGESVEIFVEGDSIILKKFSQIESLENVSVNYTSYKTSSISIVNNTSTERKISFGAVAGEYNFVDNDDIDFVQALINWVRADSKTYDYWTASFIPNAG